MNSNKQNIRRGFEKHISIVQKNQLRIAEAEEGIEKSKTSRIQATGLVRRCMRELSEMRAAAIKLLEGMFRAKFAINLPSVG